jgi:hypothetical protein
MQIIRHHSHTQKSARLYGWGALVLLIAVIALSFTNRYAASIPLLIFCIFAFQIAKEIIIPRAEKWIVGHMGEQRVLSVLRDLPDSYTAVANFVVPGSERGDIDLILIGPPGIVVIEVKSYAGDIVYENGRWWKRQRNGWKTRLKKNPSGQARGHRKTLIAFLQEERERLTVLRNLFVPIVPILVFVGAHSVEADLLDMTALQVGELLDYVRSLPPRLSESQIEDVARLFQVGDPETASGPIQTRQAG